MDVSFYPVQAEEAGVARLQRFSGGLDERAQECPAHAAWSKADRAIGRKRQTPQAVAEAAGVCD